MATPIGQPTGPQSNRRAWQCPQVDIADTPDRRAVGLGIPCATGHYWVFLFEPLFERRLWIDPKQAIGCRIWVSSALY